MPNRPNTAMLDSVSAMPSCPSQFAYSERIAKVKNAGTYAYPNIGTNDSVLVQMFDQAKARPVFEFMLQELLLGMES